MTARRVLVVEDDPDQLIVRCMLLSHYGFETRRAADAETAMRIAREEKPEIAVLDLHLPTEDIGLSLIRELRATSPDLTIIVLSGGDPERLKGIPELAMANGILQKGSSSRRLLETLQEAKAGPIRRSATG